MPKLETEFHLENDGDSDESEYGDDSYDDTSLSSSDE